MPGWSWWTATSTPLASGRRPSRGTTASGWSKTALDIETCEGAATIGLELTDTVPPFDAVLLVADDAVLVQEASIITGMRMLLDHAGLVVEPSAALGIAAILEDRDRFAGRHVVTIVCGSNVDLDAYHR